MTKLSGSNSCNPDGKPSTPQSTTKAGTPTGPASWILREEIMRNGALRRGDCLSEASLSTFSGMENNFSKIHAALNFCFFWFKPKEKENNKLERQ